MVSALRQPGGPFDEAGRETKETPKMLPPPNTLAKIKRPSAGDWTAPQVGG